MTNRIAITLTLSLSFLFGVDRPKEIETSSQKTTEIQFNTEEFQKNLHIKKEIIQNYKQARKSKSIPKPTGSPIYLSNQKSGNTLIKETPGNKISVDELIERSDEYRRKINMSERDKKAFAPMGHSQQPKTNRVDYSLLDKEEILQNIRDIKKEMGNDLPNIYLLHGEFTNE